AGAGLASASIVGGSVAPLVSSARAASITGFPATRNPAFTLDRPVTVEEEATTYTNFYEFGSSKNIWRKAQKLVTDPWIFTIEGLVDNPLQLDASELIAKTGPQEERLYRHRCVEAWAMAVPWTGVPMSRLVRLVQPKAEAKYVRLETFFDPSVAIGQRQSWYPWPYVEGMTIDEAMNEMAFIGTGLYGRAMEKQNGAPLRIVLPWKYGFKSIKSIVKMTFTDQRPVSFWEKLAANEYGFWANVNPDVDHPRWSQATERMLGTGKRVATQLYNGYGEQVAYLYKDMKEEGARLFR
ncbi:MAG: protein-methionine-sulfoxide reductase catalytic subunit MsrP, partial [Alphaproteobacteria bacterium]|nr:protein-methionine-sulfoxide reductase catalytic subunit MsrP [Alphaproteobacteria bacterium]